MSKLIQKTFNEVAEMVKDERFENRDEILLHSQALLHCHTLTNLRGRIIPTDESLATISEVDYFFLRERGLLDTHLQKFKEQEIFIEEIIGVMKIFPQLRGEKLFEKILEATEGLLETEAFYKWIENPMGKCSKDRLPGNKKYPKALVLTAFQKFRKKWVDRLIENRLIRKLDTIYNVCFEVFTSRATFFSALLNRRYEMVVIIAHGKQNEIALDNDEQPSLQLTADNLEIALSRLKSKARIILMSCYGGLGTNKEKNLANLFYLSAPRGVKVFASVENFNSLRVVLTEDSSNKLRVNFWGYIDESKITDGTPISQNIHDITYEVNSTVTLNPEV